MPEILAPSFPLHQIEAIIWSHSHFDHIGDPSVFPSTTAVITGPGFKANFLPGYPTNANSPIPESAYSGREVIELDFADPNRWKILTVGPFRAIDYFEDGSFYLLDAPGHAVGHICALARVTSSLSHPSFDAALPPGGRRVSLVRDSEEDDSFVLLAGDAFHHAGELRPSEYVPLPKEIVPSPFGDGRKACLGEVFDRVMKGGRAKPVYKSVGPWHYDFARLGKTIRKLQVADGTGNVLVATAHDESLLGVVEFYPKTMNGFLKEGWLGKARWGFLRDFGEAVGMGETGNRRRWGAGKDGGEERS